MLNIVTLSRSCPQAFPASHFLFFSFSLLTMPFHFFFLLLFPLPSSFRFYSLIGDSKMLGVMVTGKDAYHCNTHRGLRSSVTSVNDVFLPCRSYILGMVNCFIAPW